MVPETTSDEPYSEAQNFKVLRPMKVPKSGYYMCSQVEHGRICFESYILDISQSQ